MTKAKLSDHIRSRKPSSIRQAQLDFAARGDSDRITAVNVAIGNVSLPMHPAMQDRMDSLRSEESPFKDGVVKYVPTVGTDEARKAFLHVIEASGFEAGDLEAMVTDGGSHAMELIILATCGVVEGRKRPLMLIDAAYTNYTAFAKRLGIETVAIERKLGSDGKFSLPQESEIDALMEQHKPGAVVVIPYDNPTGQFYGQEQLEILGKLVVKHNAWLVSDEAYRELFYTGGEVSSVWGLSEAHVPGIEGRRVSIETASKVWNACGLRIGALVMDDADLHRQLVFENTANLCSPAIDQYIFAGLNSVGESELRGWFESQREYYGFILKELRDGLKEKLPELVVSSPDASLYVVVDVRDVAGVDGKFDCAEFVGWCAREGKVGVEGSDHTLLVAPMAGFYSGSSGKDNPGRTQMRIAAVESQEHMKLVPELLSGLLGEYLGG